MHSSLLLTLRRLRAPIILLIVVFAVGMVGLVLIPGVDADGRPWRMSLFQAFYFTTEENMDIAVPGGKPLTAIRKGSIYVRSGASNQILTADAFEKLLRRRIERFRTKLMEGLARVVHSEPTQEVIIVSPQPEGGGRTSFRITDAPDAIAVRGTSLALVPKTLEDQVAAWVSINKADPNDQPLRESLMAVYAQRKTLVLNDDQKYWLSVFSLVQGLPAFFWLYGQEESSIHSALEKAFAQANNPERLYILNVSGFYGRRTYNKYLAKLRAMSWARLDDFRDLNSIFRTSKSVSVQDDENEANGLAVALSKKYDVGVLSRLQKLDCALYAPFE